MPQCGPGNKAADGALYASYTPCPSRLQCPWSSYPTTTKREGRTPPPLLRKWCWNPGIATALRSVVVPVPQDLQHAKLSPQSALPFVWIFICNDMRDDRDIMRQCRQIYAQGNILVRKFNMCSNAVKITSTLFRTYCSSLYTSQLWWNRGTIVTPQLRRCTLHTIMLLECYVGCPVTVVLVACLLRMVSFAT